MQYADARVVAGTMTSLFEQRYAAIRTADVQRSKPIILADPRSNSLLVAASQDDNRTLDELLKRLDAKQDTPALALTVVPLKHNDPPASPPWSRPSSPRGCARRSCPARLPSRASRSRSSRTR